MIEWLRWIVVIGLIVGAYFQGKSDGQGKEQLAQAQASVKQLTGVVESQKQEIAAGKERAEQERADLVAMQTALTTIERRTSGIGGALQRALNESQMGTCVLDDAVRRVRADAYQAAADATAAANRARGDGR